MCNLSAGVEAKGIAKGLERGRAEGEAKGVAIGEKKKAVESAIIKDLECS